MPASTSLPSVPNSGPRWSIVGKSIARSTRSGTLVGPGICRKWRPARRWERRGHCGILTTLPMNAPLIPVRFARGRPLRSRRAPAQGAGRRGPVRRGQPRPLFDRRVDLPDRADRRRCAPQRRSGPGRDRDRGRGGRSDPAARRRHLAVRPDGRRGAGHRPHQVSEPRAAGRPGSPARRRAARHRARSPERAAAQARPVVSGRCLDQRAGDDRRHDRQQLVRLALDRATATWCTTSSPIDACHDRRRALALRADGAEPFGFVWRVHRAG